jgi:isochorismate hydrolase
MYLPETMAILQKHSERDQLILVGVEAHVCILQSCLDFLDHQFQVFLLQDGITSVRSWERNIALERMKKEGAIATTF